MNKKYKYSKIKLISAGIFLLLGLILAIGYPTGGVKANKVQQKQVVQKKVVADQNTKKSKSAVIKKEEPKKKRVIPVTPPPSNEGEDDKVVNLVYSCLIQIFILILG